MPKLYICNSTQQKHEFIYRMPERLQTSAPMTILPGSQVMIIDSTTNIISHIIEQHRIYGLKHFKEVDTKTFNGLIYSVDKPVELETIFLAEEANTKVLNDLGSQIRQEQAAAFSGTLDDALPDSVNSLKVEVVEENRPGVETNLRETIEVEKPKRGRK